MSKVGRRMQRAEAEAILGKLRAAAPSAGWVPAGSYRRGEAEVGDLDLVVPAEAYGRTCRALEAVCATLLTRKADGKIVGGLSHGVGIELYVAKEGALGAMLLHATGSKAFNIFCRDLAVRRGWKLNQYGLFERESGECLAAKAEREILERLGIGWVEPERREAGPWRSSTAS